MRVLLTAASLALAAPMAHAQPAPPMHPVQAPLLHGNLAGFGGDPDALPRAIRTIQAAGGRVTEIRFDSQLGHPAFDAAVMRGGVITFLRVTEPELGTLTAARQQEEPVTGLRPRAQRDLALLDQADVGLAGAVETAEEDNRGTSAVAAGLATLTSDPIQTAPVYNVLLLRSDGVLIRTAVDARTGLTIGNLPPLTERPVGGL